MKRTLRFARVLVGGDSGSTATEYALIASLIAMVILLSVALLGQNVSGLFQEAASSLPG